MIFLCRWEIWGSYTKILFSIWCCIKSWALWRVQFCLGTHEDTVMGCGNCPNSRWYTVIIFSPIISCNIINQHSWMEGNRPSECNKNGIHKESIAINSSYHQANGRQRNIKLLSLGTKFGGSIHRERQTTPGHEGQKVRHHQLQTLEGQTHEMFTEK